jgi:hypothetical protein
MAFEPTQLLINFDEAIKEFEIYFDEKLQRHKVDKYDTFVEIPVPKGYSEAHHRAIRPIYEKAGWSLVTLSSDRVRFYAK